MLFILFGLSNYEQYFVMGFSLIFVAAWIGQFIGHKIEGKKPSFFDDLFFLLIGPIWVVAPFTKKILRPIK